MTARTNSLLATRRSLISRLRNCDDQESWRDFFTTYWKLIYSFAVRCGCSDTEAEEVVQETMVSLAKKMPEYRYDPATCSFKGWLLHVTNWRVIDQLRKRRSEEAPALPVGNAAAELVDQMAGPTAPELEALWDEEWQKNMIDAAMQRVKRKVNSEQYQIFHLLAVKGQGAREVAGLLGVNIAKVYLAKHAVAKLVKKEIEVLTRKLR
jgi:RNA polymerase sigma factor (sigma-70 family)